MDVSTITRSRLSATFKSKRISRRTQWNYFSHFQIKEQSCEIRRISSCVRSFEGNVTNEAKRATRGMNHARQKERGILVLRLNSARKSPRMHFIIAIATRVERDPYFVNDAKNNRNLKYTTTIVPCGST